MIEKRPIIVGVDYSKNSPAAVKLIMNENFEIVEHRFIGFSTTKKGVTDNIHHLIKKSFLDDIAQYLWVNDILQDFILDDDVGVDYVAFEGYAFGAKHRGFEIAEATGDMKRRVYEQGAWMRIYDPMSIKMFATGSGSAKKPDMAAAFEKVDSSERPQLSEVNEDIIDAYWVTKLLQIELKLRSGQVHTKNLPEHQVRVFNRVTKTNPENILVRPFIEKEHKVIL